MAAYIFSSDPVWSQTTKSGFLQQVFVMYHSTKGYKNARKIVETGFNISQNDPENPDRNLTLGDGLYVTRDIEKSVEYGDICFKLLVYPGKTYQVTDIKDELRTTWHKEHSSAWVPPNFKVHPSGKEETCVKSSAQVRILGVANGHHLLDGDLQSRLRDLFGTADSLDPIENRVLDMMLEDLGIIYCTFVHQGSQLMLESKRNTGELRLAEWNGRDNQLWSRTWDNCLENKASGHVLTVEEGRDNVDLKPVEAIGDSRQKWRLDHRGRMLHKASKLLLGITSNERPELKGYNEGGDRESWSFRCLDETRRLDTYVQFTPWQDLISWD